MIGIFLAGLIFAQVFLAGLRFEKLVFKRIVDGDTFWVTNFRDGSEWKVRLWGVDSPDQGKCYFDEATKILEQELTTKKITFDRKGTMDMAEFWREYMWMERVWKKYWWRLERQ